MKNLYISHLTFVRYWISKSSNSKSIDKVKDLDFKISYYNNWKKQIDMFILKFPLYSIHRKIILFFWPLKYSLTKI